jgi:MazG C-terminal domain/MazG nucleotide pyrophosphohydrolase domain
MNLEDYQRRAEQTDQRPSDGDGSHRCDDAFVIPLLGIGGELGTLQAEYKKFLRDGDAYAPFREHIKEELGDIFWYVANLATKFGLPLDDIAASNLAKVEDRWGPSPWPARRPDDLFDGAAVAREQLPRHFEVEFRKSESSDRPEPIVQAFWNGRTFGDPLGDNAYDDDGYRYHDAFHLAHAAVLGWSPVCRREKQFDCKRRSDSRVDAVEDGGRAIVTEEAIVAYVYGHARDHGWFEEVDAVDFAILKTIRGLTADLEVSTRPARDWERAILDGYRVWRQLWRNDGGVLVGDLVAATIDYRPVKR